ncbi:hypothetical protein N7489_006666 [Penicillium chrysogenum]|uniref:Uncharacterized protein n=1 Tax=Penicillium chrysogenum TaxID=5076 RepID=A0ABQ8W4A8_PENCH|nr:uncharacterized protein N7489_006666 [Penicillium chrysogenum]KAJ5236575.1 hypothetical protein N7489_006666 [Penicillium chrysogenum]KAJ5255479.1 hypothetical protein N7505_010630 [Penicillium chrysogenum]KAJ6152715.1 hypothetical protein N7497_007034 [Penicillium chrysogenum]
MFTRSPLFLPNGETLLITSQSVEKQTWRPTQADCFLSWFTTPSGTKRFRYRGNRSAGIPHSGLRDADSSFQDF